MYTIMFQNHTKLIRFILKALPVCIPDGYREIATRHAHGLESDVWSLGCMLYTLLVGHPPFDVSPDSCDLPSFQSYHS